MAVTYKRKSTSTPKRTAKYIKVSSLEKKEHLVQAALALPVNSYATGFLDRVPTGTLQNQKIGSKIRVISIEVVGSLGANSNAPQSTTVSLVLAKSSPTTSTGDYLGPFPLDEAGTLLACSVNGGPDSGGGPGFHFKHRFMGTGMLVQFDKDLTTIPQNYSLHLVFNNPNTTVATNVFYTAKMIYTDA